MSGVSWKIKARGKEFAMTRRWNYTAVYIEEWGKPIMERNPKILFLVDDYVDEHNRTAINEIKKICRDRLNAMTDEELETFLR